MNIKWESLGNIAITFIIKTDIIIKDSMYFLSFAKYDEVVLKFSILSWNVINKLKWLSDEKNVHLHIPMSFLFNKISLQGVRM